MVVRAVLVKGKLASPIVQPQRPDVLLVAGSPCEVIFARDPEQGNAGNNCTPQSDDGRGGNNGGVSLPVLLSPNMYSQTFVAESSELLRYRRRERGCNAIYLFQT